MIDAGADRPVVVEAAINGANPDAPRTPADITRCVLACFDAGAAVVHNHIDLFGTADEAANRYREGWDPVLAARPDVLLYPTINGIGAVEERYSHITPLAEAGGLRIGVIDPGSVNLGASFVYVNAGADIEHQWKLCDEHGLVPGMSIFEPGFLRVRRSRYWRAGKLPAGTMLRFYFGGREAEADGGFTFGLAPDRSGARRVPRAPRRLPAAVVGHRRRRRSLRHRPARARSGAWRSPPRRPRGPSWSAGDQRGAGRAGGRRRAGVWSAGGRLHDRGSVPRAEAGVSAFLGAPAGGRYGEGTPHSWGRTTMHVDDMILVSIDDHVVEPPDMFEQPRAGEVRATARRRS